MLPDAKPSIVLEFSVGLCHLCTEVRTRLITGPILQFNSVPKGNVRVALVAV